LFYKKAVDSPQLFTVNFISSLFDYAETVRWYSSAAKNRSSFFVFFFPALAAFAACSTISATAVPVFP
jgi:hypothetical protein